MTSRLPWIAWLLVLILGFTAPARAMQAMQILPTALPDLSKNAQKATYGNFHTRSYPINFSDPSGKGPEAVAVLTIPGVGEFVAVAAIGSGTIYLIQKTSGLNAVLRILGAVLGSESPAGNEVPQDPTLNVTPVTPGGKAGGDISGAAMPPGGPFTSTDPLVGDVANAIEAKYPGHVQGVNVPVKDPATGKLITDIDILLQNAAIQVKEGGGKKMTKQMLKTRDACPGLKIIAYGPDLGGAVTKGMEKEGFIVIKDLQQLLARIRP